MADSQPWLDMNKQKQLGINPSTASHRLVKDILFSYVKDTPCFHCKLPLTRETFSIEHKIPWLHSENPLELFFSLENISFSHMSCNREAARSTKIPVSVRSKNISDYNKKYKLSFTDEERKEKRRNQYLRTRK